MEPIIIDTDKEFVEALYKKICPDKNAEQRPKPAKDINGGGEEINLKKAGCSEIVQGVIKIKNDNQVIFININGEFSGAKRQEQKGIELLIWLRIMDVMNHVVLYSFETLHTLLSRNPRHLIATSQGTTVLRLPTTFEKIKELADKIGFKLADISSVRQTLKVTFNNEGLRHALANIYGLWFMFNTHNQYLPNEKLDYTIFSKEFINRFDELQLRIAEYLTRKEYNLNSTSILSNQVNQLRNKIKQKNPKILYIDDKADIGWAEFLKKAIYGNSQSSNFQSIVPKPASFMPDGNFEELVEEVKLKILNNKNFIDCLLLDLRLAEEQGDIDNLDNLSGIRLLKRIHQIFPSLPVIMFTATNKAKSVKKVLDYGAENLWTKPGLDDLKDNEYYLHSYLELLIYLDDALNKYTTRVEKFIVDAQFQVETIDKSKAYPKELANVSVILTDTTFWCETTRLLVNNHKSARKLLNINEDNVHRKSFIVINDVISELFIHTQNKNRPELQNSALYGMETIQDYREKEWIGTGFAEVEQAIKETTSYLKEKAPVHGFHIISNVKKVHSYHIDSEDADKELSKRKSLTFRALHADDTFQMLISSLLKKNKNLIIVTDDFNTNVPNIIRTIEYKFNLEHCEIPENFNKENDLLKMVIPGQFCLIAHSKVLYKICFPQRGEYINIIQIPNVT